jgi:hypothetical protein
MFFPFPQLRIQWVNPRSLPKGVGPEPFDFAQDVPVEGRLEAFSLFANPPDL